METKEDLILNWDFELWSTSPDNWNQWGWGTNTAVFTYPVTWKNSEKACKVEISSYVDWDAKRVHDMVAVTAGLEYSYTDWYKTNIDSELTVWYWDWANWTYSWKGSLWTTAWEWTKSSVTFTPPVWTTHCIMFHLIAWIWYLIIDRVKLKLA